MSAYDPKRTSSASICCGAQWLPSDALTASLYRGWLWAMGTGVQIEEFLCAKFKGPNSDFEASGAG